MDLELGLIETSGVTTGKIEHYIPQEIQIELDSLKKDVEELKDKLHRLQIRTMFS